MYQLKASNNSELGGNNVDSPQFSKENYFIYLLTTFRKKKIAENK